MPIHFRMIDALSEAHIKAIKQKKYDLAEILLQAITLEHDKYGKAAGVEKRGQSMDLLALARERQKAVRVDS